jgi:uncharacterized integral membrane protein
MLGKIARVVLLVPLGVVIVLFAVANRHGVTVSFDPFSSADPAYTATVPLFILIFALLITGVVVGGVASWMRQARYRRLARRLEAENRALHSELYELKRQYAANERSPAPAVAARVDAPPLALRSPVE